ncbi:hypothetical protein B0H13DRAFT_1854942 [Mycena leptocephala]|nr:hypothetical protein B0H13DRAFT_1854942 [Mycena leptocephala]
MGFPIHFWIHEGFDQTAFHAGCAPSRFCYTRSISDPEGAHRCFAARAGGAPRFPHPPSFTFDSLAGWCEALELALFAFGRAADNWSRILFPSIQVLSSRSFESANAGPNNGSSLNQTRVDATVLWSMVCSPQRTPPPAASPSEAAVKSVERGNDIFGWLGDMLACEVVGAAINGGDAKKRMLLPGSSVPKRKLVRWLGPRGLFNSMISRRPRGHYGRGGVIVASGRSDCDAPKTSDADMRDIPT